MNRRGTSSTKYRDWLEETWAIKGQVYAETRRLHAKDVLAYFREHAEASPTWARINRRTARGAAQFAVR